MNKDLNFERILKNSAWSYTKYNDFKHNKEKYYSKFYITKKSGGKREIDSPLFDVYSVQKNVQVYLENITSQKDNVHGFVRGKSHITNAKVHLESNYILNCDVHDFFGSITRKMVFSLLVDLGSDSVSANKLSHFCTLDDSLPQGSPCSPILSNIYMQKFDENMILYATANNLVYTRYVDDISISSTEEFDVPSLLKAINFELRKLELQLNYKKTRVLSSRNYLEVTGIRIIDGQLRIKKSYVKKIRKELYFIGKFGVFSHMEKANIKNVLYKEHLYGKIIYIMTIDEKLGTDLLNIYNTIDWTK